MAEHPYSTFPAEAFWRTGVAEKEPLDIAGLWQPKFPISSTERIVTAGSCFAQHIGRSLTANGFCWFDAEPAPYGLPDPAVFNYGIFSFRSGNIYTAAMLRQWLEWSIAGNSGLAEELEIYAERGRYFDAFRPLIEPNGFASQDEVAQSREATFAAIRRALMADVFVFTLGLTEAWRNAKTGLTYPACPGTQAGAFDASRHVFVNHDYEEVERDLWRAIEIARSVNPDLRFLLTVSPVPLTATASGDHVLAATTYSKSVLRAVAGRSAKKEGVDYFPSYEIITGTPFRGMFYAANLREVTSRGVAHVMTQFFDGMAHKFPGCATTRDPQPAPPCSNDDDDVVCEDILLEEFNRNG